MMNEEYPMLHLFDRTLDLVCIVDKAGWFKRVNPAVSKTLGYTEKELLARPVADLIHPEDRQLTADKRLQLLKNEPLLNFQNRYIAKSGEAVWLEWTSVYIPEQEVVFAIAKNITERKKAELEVEENYKKYKTLTAHFKQHVEKDRRHFATELHEELAQLATVVKMNLEWIAGQQQTDEIFQKQVKHALATSELMLNKIRKLSYSINPAQIEELGLDAVLRSLCQEFSTLTNIPSSYKSSFNEKDLTHEVKLDLLRICQEALLNVMHHAQATQVRIKLEEKKDRIELSVVDNGKGFEYKSRQSFGFRNMHGRAASIDGELLIESKKSKGTRVSVSVETKK
jgi:PAS domain S-box-containing protein